MELLIHVLKKGGNVIYFIICLSEKYLDVVIEFFVLRNTELILLIYISMIFILFVEKKKLYLFLEDVVYCEVNELNT